MTRQPVNVSASKPAGLYRVKVGPIAELAQVQQLSERLVALDMGQPRLLTE